MNNQIKGFRALRKKLLNAPDMASLHPTTELLDWLAKTKSWKNLTEAQREAVMTNPTAYKKFMEKLYSSREMQLREAKMHLMEPSASIGVVEVVSGVPVQQILAQAEQALQIDKKTNKGRIKSKLPVDSSEITKDDIYIPHF